MTSFAKIAAQVSVGVKRQFLSPEKIRVILPWGFPYEAFGANVVVKPWHILNLVESGRALTFNVAPPEFIGRPFLKIQDLYKDYAVFQGSARLTVAKEMYDITLPKTPLTLEKSLVYVGRSSMNIHTDVMLPSHDLTLASCEIQSVTVDRKTRLPSPLPDWWRKEFGGLSAPERQLRVNVRRAGDEQTCLREEPLNHGDVSKSPGVSHNHTSKHQVANGRISADLSHPEPGLDSYQDPPITDCVTSFDTIINYSDIDPYGHANWAVFLKYCVDAMILGHSSEVRASLQSLALKSADISFVREGSLGKRMTVKFWKDADIPRAVHFNVVEKDSGQLVTYVFLQFYSLQAVRLPVAKL
ncbi:uncharacterized protein LOC143276546 [Babylonia areolata]|uniref:uncharacterized protein LOC143276546 n=1 Tax=Babylonia areolata TaxID=304850 RepID=UPI003FD12FC9